VQEKVCLHYAGGWTTIDDGVQFRQVLYGKKYISVISFALELAVILLLLVLNRFSQQNAVLDEEQNLPELCSHPVIQTIVNLQGNQLSLYCTSL